ncbi:hypothetical protein VH1709_contig00017-0003 [Vibrio harveyi]|nr:hypothetical protein VH1709_contig00017-0003 [Vibrio harveyi]
MLGALDKLLRRFVGENKVAPVIANEHIENKKRVRVVFG